jgi:Domain of unknown function (DUF4350)
MSSAARSLDPTARELWRRGRAALAIIGAVVVLGTIFGVLQSRTSGGPLDPQSARQGGGRALAVLLERQGVEVVRARTLADATTETGDDATLLVTQPGLLAPDQLDNLARTPVPHLVLLAPDEEVLTALAPGAIPAGEAFPRVREPGCDLRPAARAGTVRAEGMMYRTLATAEATMCYGDGTRGALVRIGQVPVRAGDSTPSSTRTVDLVGMPGSFSNARLDEEGHAALALNLLGDQRRVVWYVPSLTDVPRTGAPGAPGQQGVFQLLPEELRFGLVQLAVAVVLLMLVSARRLGPVVAEPLPVVVRASEAVEGRARLYHRARARGRAAAALREACRSRIAPLLGLPTGAEMPAVVAAVASRTGRPAADVARTLGSVPAGGTARRGPNDTAPTDTATDTAPTDTARTDSEPVDDRALVRLADDLDTLEQEVRRS